MILDPANELRLIPLSSPFLEVWFNGIYLCLVVFTVWSIVSKSGRTARENISIVLVVVMYIIATVHAATGWWLEVHSFANFGATPDIVDALVHNPVWYKAIGASMFALNILIADCLFIWRCWVVWSRCWTITIVPIVATLTGTVLAVISIVGQVLVTQSRTPGVVPLHFVKFSTPYLTLSCATSQLTTALIAVRIFQVQREFKSIGSQPFHRRSHAKVVEIIVESAVIYSVNLLVFVVLTAMKSINLSYPQNIHPQIAGIAPTLIIFRVALGHSRTDSEWSSTNSRYNTGNMSFILRKNSNSPTLRKAAQLPPGHNVASLPYMSEFSASPSRTMYSLPESFEARREQHACANDVNVSDRDCAGNDYVTGENRRVTLA